MSVAKRPYRVSPAEPLTSSDLRGWWIPDAGIAALRAFLAAMLLRHGLQDHVGILLPAGVAWAGEPLALSDRWLAATALVAGGVLLLAGWFTRTVSLAVAIVVLLGAFASPATRGHWAPVGTELVTWYVGVLLAFTLVGPGLFSVDAARSGRTRRRRSGMTVSMSPWIRREYRRRELTR